MLAAHVWRYFSGPELWGLRASLFPPFSTALRAGPLDTGPNSAAQLLRLLRASDKESRNCMHYHFQVLVASHSTLLAL